MPVVGGREGGKKKEERTYSIMFTSQRSFFPHSFFPFFLLLSCLVLPGGRSNEDANMEEQQKKDSLPL